MSIFIPKARLLSCSRLLPKTAPSRIYLQARNLASMSQTPSLACCNTPPVVSKGYQEKGQYTTIDGMKTYSTGPDSTSGILVIYDIFGFFPQTLQGADILSGLHHKEQNRKFQVFMPDFFEGKPADISWYPPDNDEKGKKLGDFFAGPAAPPKTVARVARVMQELKDKHPNIRNWGVLGYCWGGKIVNLVSQQGTPFRAAATAHPAMVDPADAPEVTIPFIMLPSGDESKDDVNKYKAALKVKNEVEWFGDQVHGFMAARGNLEDESVKKAYEQGYSILSNWFADNLGSKESKL